MFTNAQKKAHLSQPQYQVARYCFIRDLGIEDERKGGRGKQRSCLKDYSVLNELHKNCR